MNKTIKDIIDSDKSTSDKMEELDHILDNIVLAKNILEGVSTGKYTYCPQCEDYYLSRSFLTEERKQRDGRYKVYRVCPKDHVKEL